ncbi:MAG TPA: hypothetical protein PLX55_02675 [bacterium]|jgi:hypothetical protein|nr:hypothetical protein [bacterium]
MSFKLKYSTKRLLEIVPGALTWLALLGPIVLSVWIPWVVAIYILTFDLYWFFRSLRLANFTVRTYKKMRRDMDTDWHNIVKSKDLPTQNGEGHKLVVSQISEKDLIHVVLLIYYKESEELLARSIESYIQSTVDKDKLWLVMASEERAGKSAKEAFENLKEKYKSHFAKFVQTVHPADIKGEIKCKSANATWAAKELKKILDKKNMRYDHVIIHNFDADTCVAPNYFDYVAYKYLTSVMGEPTSFQPIQLYSNNIWDAPAMSRVVAQSSTMVLMYNTMRPFWYQCFSSRSDVFKTIVDIGYWTVDSIPEDSRQYFDSYFYYEGKIKIEPLFVPLKLDAVLAETWWKTLVNQYNQLRRWAWGIVDFPYIIELSIRDRAISFWNKLGKIILLLYNHFTRAIAAVHIAFVGWMPGILSPEFRETVLGYNMQIFARWILTGALLGLFVSIVLQYLLLPPRPSHRSKWFYINFAWQWLLVPVVSIGLSSVSAIDAQTRLMFGRYLEYQVTEKAIAVGGKTKKSRQ